MMEESVTDNPFGEGEPEAATPGEPQNDELVDEPVNEPEEHDNPFGEKHEEVTHPIQTQAAEDTPPKPTTQTHIEDDKPASSPSSSSPKPQAVSSPQPPPPPPQQQQQEQQQEESKQPKSPPKQTQQQQQQQQQQAPASQPKPADPKATGKPANWVPDESSTSCTTCKTAFTFLNRRHHCRRCGGLFCNDCCGLNTSLPEKYGQKKRSRVCNKCFKANIKERLQTPDFTTIADGGPSTETKVVSSMLKVLYWKMGAHEGGMFDRTTIDVGETSAGAISVQQVQDLMTDTEVNPVRIRLYTPTHKWKGSEKRAVLVWFHTGHFCTRSIESPSVDGLARLLANQVPVTIVSVDYRLAPDNAFPAAVEDGYEAVSWAVKNSVSLESHPSLISVGGDGAGGNIAAAVALMARDKGLPGGAKLLTQLLVTPPLNLTENPTGPEYASREANKNAYMLPLSQFNWFAQQYTKGAQEKTSPYLSPILASDLSNLPAALVLGAGHDLFHSEAKAYANKLRAAGVRVVHTLYSNSANGFFGSGLDESDEAVMELVLFLSYSIIAQVKKL